jgi:carboxypeptidase family protein/TonB-dependent receptor-like protein
MRRYLLFLLTLMGMVGASRAQTAGVRGFVTDAESEQVLQGATVVLTSPGDRVLGEATDGDGYFSFARVPPGSWEVRVSFVGYVTHVGRLTLSRGELKTLSIDLEPSEEVLGEALVIAEAESGIAAVTAGLEVIRPADVDRVPVPGVSGDLAAYLQSVPGVVLPGDRGGQFHIRGGSQDQNQVFLDGIPVYAPLHILSFFSAFPEEVIDGVDFYTGGFGAKYGERMSSVLDVSARNGNKQNIAGAVAIAPFLSGVRIEGPLVSDRASFLFSGRRSLVEELTPELFGERFGYQFGDMFGKVHALLGRRHSLSLTGLYTFDRGDLAGTPKTFQGEAIPIAYNDSTEIAWTNAVVGARYEVLPGRIPAKLTLTSGFSSSEQNFGPPESPQRTSSIESIDVRVDAEYYLASMDVAAGALFRNSDLAYRVNGQFEDFPNRASSSFNEFASYLTATWHNARLEVEPGLRFYAIPTLDKSLFEPRLRLKWSASARHDISAAWGLYHQALVGLSDERDIGNVFTAWIPASAEQDLPQSMHAIMGWSGRFGGGVRMAVEGYYKSYSSLQVPIFSAFPRFTTRLQQADGTAYGADFRLEFAEREFVEDTRIQGRVSYSLGKVEYETESGEVFPPGHDRRHLVQGLMSVNKGEVTLSVQAQYGTGLPFTPSGGFDQWYLFTPDVDVTRDAGQDRVLYAEPNSARQPTYARLDIFIERRIERGRYVGTLRAGAINVFNRQNLFYFDLFTFRRVDQLPLVPSVGMKLELR